MNLKSQIHRISCFPYRHEGRSQEILLALCSFLLLSQKVSPFPLSRIGRYTPYRHFERSREIFLALCSFLLLSQKVSPFPLSRIGRYTPYRHFERSEKSSSHSTFLAPFAKGFPFSAVSHRTLYQCARKIPRLRSG